MAAAMDTIFAPASGRVKSAVSVVRLSGPASRGALEAVTGGRAPDRPRLLALRRLRDAAGGIIDEGLVVWFAAGSSFTGEESAEIHVHGSPAVLSRMLEVLGRMPGLRLAEPGEFARRAFEAGRLDLAQVEGLADLVAAETEAQRQQALRVAGGAVGRMVEGWRGTLVRALALVEAGIDFSEEDLPAGLMAEVLAGVTSVLPEMRHEVAGSRIAERVRDGFEVAIVGRPNAGKSTLLNALAGREAALTSAEAGTTRDVIEVRMVLDGLPVTVLDTAGIRDRADGVEAMGVERGLERARGADLRVFLLSHPGDTPVFDPDAEDVVVVGKADLLPAGDDVVSGKTGLGLDRLTARIGSVLSSRAAASGTLVAARQRAAVEAAIGALESAAERLSCAEVAGELVAGDIREALMALDRVAGRFDVEDVLDAVFSTFCIGK